MAEKGKTTQVTEESSSNFSVSEFLKGTKEELDKVVWPSRQQLISESIAVILMVTLSATIIYLIDNLFIWAAGKVF
jgi:preprotein translocase subunit SecE